MSFLPSTLEKVNLTKLAVSIQPGLTNQTEAAFFIPTQKTLSSNAHTATKVFSQQEVITVNNSRHTKSETQKRPPTTGHNFTTWTSMSDTAARPAPAYPDPARPKRYP